MRLFRFPPSLGFVSGGADSPFFSSESKTDRCECYGGSNSIIDLDVGNGDQHVTVEYLHWEVKVDGGSYVVKSSTALLKKGQAATLRLIGEITDVGESCQGCITQVYVRGVHGDNCIYSGLSGGAFDVDVEFDGAEEPGVYSFYFGWSWEQACFDNFAGLGSVPLAQVFVEGEYVMDPGTTNERCGYSWDEGFGVWTSWSEFDWEGKGTEYDGCASKSIDLCSALPLQKESPGYGIPHFYLVYLANSILWMCFAYLSRKSNETCMVMVCFVFSGLSFIMVFVWTAPNNCHEEGEAIDWIAAAFVIIVFPVSLLFSLVMGINFCFSSQLEFQNNSVVSDSIREYSRPIGASELEIGPGVGRGECAICMEEFTAREIEKEEVRKLWACGHMFHEKCLKGWVRGNIGGRSCPLCRIKVDEGKKKAKGVLLSAGELRL